MIEIKQDTDEQIKKERKKNEETITKVIKKERPNVSNKNRTVKQKLTDLRKAFYEPKESLL